MRLTRLCGIVVFAAAFAASLPAAWADGQYGGGGMQGGGMQGGRPGGMGQQHGGGDEMPPSAPVVKPDAAAKKAFAAGTKFLGKAKDAEAAAAKAPNEDKKNGELEKAGDFYNRALDFFTEALSNNVDMVDAWDNVGYIHFHLGAYQESIDDFNHTLALSPDRLEAVQYRGEAFLHVDRLDDAKMAYMDLFNHDRPLADHLMAAMEKWLVAHRSAANGVRAADIDSFDKWLQEREGIAKQTASAAPAL